MIEFTSGFRTQVNLPRPRPRPRALPRAREFPGVLGLPRLVSPTVSLLPGVLRILDDRSIVRPSPEATDTESYNKKFQAV